jgi:hypothetical protein
MSTVPVPSEPSSHLSGGVHALKERPIAALVTIFCIVLFVVHLHGIWKVDLYAIILLALAAAPWSLPELNTVADAMRQFLQSANLSSVQVAGIKVESRVDQLEKKVDEHRRILDDLTVDLIAFYIYDKLKHLHLGALNPNGPYREFKYYDEEGFNHDLRYLRDHGYLEWFDFKDLVPEENLVGRVKVTRMGQRFVDLKEKMSPP